ncbi:hypothetical protein FV219_01645 [Methylobacterium sp. WL122]|nr:hypothetical protein FV219_01645 [Methylobacterium sp. WL122]
MFKIISTVAFASAWGLAALTGPSQARTVAHATENPAATGSILPQAQSPDWLGRMDTDSGNSRNPALPSYAQGRGQETGGPARELIPN